MVSSESSSRWKSSPPQSSQMPVRAGGSYRTCQTRSQRRQVRRADSRRTTPSSSTTTSSTPPSQPVPDHRHRYLVRYQVASFHELPGLTAELGVAGDVVPENITCRDPRDRQVRSDELGLCPLARTGGPDEDDAHYRKKPS